MKKTFLFGKQNRIICVAIISFILAFPKTVFAYVDPGIGGLVFQIGYIIFTAFVAGIAFRLKPIKKFFQRNKRKKDK